MRALLLAAALALASSAAANDFSRSAVGTTGGEFLLMDVGARGIALGGAYSAVVDDATSMYWNPAGLSRIPRASASFMYSRYVQDISYQSAQAAMRYNDLGVIGGGVRFRDIGGVDETDINANVLGTFHPRDFVTEVGWGQSILDLSDAEVDVTMGVVGRWLHSTYVVDGDGFGGDLGILSRFYTSRYTYDFSFVAQNMGMGQKFDKVRDTLPFRLKLGTVVYPTKPLMLSMEGFLPVNNDPYGAVGIEYSQYVSREIKGAVRAGFNSMTLQSLGVETCFSAGFGLNLGNLSFDYAFVPMGLLGTDTHRLSVSFNLPAKASRRYRER